MSAGVVVLVPLFFRLIIIITNQVQNVMTFNLLLIANVILLQ